MKRRVLFGVPLAILLGAPAVRILYMKSRDNLLDPVPDPEPVFAGGWVLDARDQMESVTQGDPGS